jgi:threonine synthase
MKYKSTRGGVKGLSFQEAVLSGLADDEGLLIPDHIPNVTSHLQVCAYQVYCILFFYYYIQSKYHNTYTQH